MPAFQKKIFLSVRLVVSLLILSFVSPQPETAAAKQSPFAAFVSSFSGPVSLVIWKSQYTLTLYKGDRPIKTYRAVFGKGYQDGDKQRAGDKRTPEGEFFICTMNHSKRFYKFMGLSYPGIRHAEQGLRERMITQEEYLMIKKSNEVRQPPPWDTRLGGAVGIHGRMLDSAVAPKHSREANWTDGCIAMENSDVDEIFTIVSIGTPVIILP